MMDKDTESLFSVFSAIYTKEVVENKNPHVAADKKYFPCYVVDNDGSSKPALFTEEQLDTAIQRAIKNPEDMPIRETWALRLWNCLFDAF